MIIKNWTLAIDFSKGIIYRPMQFVEGDAGSSAITFNVAQDITDTRVFVTFLLSDNSTLLLEAFPTDEHTAYLELPSDVLGVAGRVDCQVALYGYEGRLTNAVSFYYMVVADLSSGVIQASDKLPILTQLITDCDAIKDEEALRVIAEGFAEPRSGRVGAELDRVDAEDARVGAENIRLANEGNANSGRVKAELDRSAAELLRASAEGAASPKSGRVGAELDRVDAELARVTAEGDATKGRVKAENERITAEAARALAEGDATKGRVKAENDRVTAEESRVEAEVARSVFEAYNAETAYVVGNKVVYSGSSYRCIQDGTGKTPSSETAYWLLIASGGTGTSVITGYEEAATNAPIAATDTINEALGKAQKQISDNADLISTNVGDLETLTTTDKSSLVNATNEVKNLVDTNTQFTDVDNVVYSWRFIKSAEGHMQLEYTEVI